MVRIIFSLFVFAIASCAWADSVHTFDGRVIDGVIKIDPRGGVTISPRSGGSPVRVDFSQLLRARFDGADDLADQSSGELWRGTDIGNVGLAGSHKFANGQLTVEAAGQDIKGTADSFRMVWQRMSGDGEVWARLTSAGQSRQGMVAGVMMRQSTDPDSAFVALLMERNGPLSVVSRQNSRDECRVVASAANERTPIWLRLVRKGDTISAYRSTDTRTWNFLAEGKFDRSGDVLAGMAVASRDLKSLCAAVFEKPKVAPDQPAGANITDLTDLRPTIARMQRPNVINKIAILNTVSVNGRTIMQGLIGHASCEIRYAINGKYNTLIGDVSLSDRENRRGSAVFQIFADNDKVFDSGKVTGNDRPIPLNINVTGHKELRLVVIDSSDPNTGYSSAEFRQLRLLTNSVARQVTRTEAGIITTIDGAIYSGADVREITKDKLKFARGDQRDLQIDLSRVSRIYQPGLTQEAIAKLPGHSTGVLMAGGDFYEGDIDRLADGKVVVSSVIFGPREFNISREVSAILLRRLSAETKPAEFVVQAIDGSVLMADSLSGDQGKWVVADRNVGKLLIEPRSVKEIRYGGDRLQWLSDLRPRRVENTSARSAADSFLIDSTIFGADLLLTGLHCDRGISLSAGSSVSYDLDGKYKSLLCMAGVPGDMLPSATAVFVVEADGKELFRSPPRNSIQDPLPVTIDAGKIKSLTFRVESENGSSMPIVGLWGDPILVKTTP